MMITIPCELPGLNEIIADAKQTKKKYAAYARVKRDFTEVCGYCALKRESIHEKVDVTITWYTKDERKDPDNIAAGIKFILDGFVAAGLLKGDGRKNIGRIMHEFITDRNNPRVVVELVPVRERIRNG